MYRFTGELTPDQIEAIAALTFMEMLEAGYASVGEFHYLHHQPGGAPYGDISELSHRICAAAASTGIGLTHLPVLYSYGGAGKQDLQSGQLRFANDVEQFCRLVERAQQAVAQLPADCLIGIAPHSLRATSPDDLNAVLAAHPSGPVHIHIAEQPREVAEVRAWLGARPVEWLLESYKVDSRWCLIHATHMSHEETTSMARTGAVAGLCPITEANLGDGPFNGPDYLAAGGQFGVGSDSNVLISLTEELRTLEYSQRLRDLSRNVLVDGKGSVGASLYGRAATGGARALGRGTGELAVGEWADLVAINSEAASLCALSSDQLLDGLVFASNDTVVTDVWSAGRHTVRDGRHIHRGKVIRRYREAISGLIASL